MNNNYVHDLRNNLAAMIDELDRRKLADRTRLAIGGHSYGAFSTVNAMVHTPFFKAGIAGRRRLQPHADAARVPDRAPRSVGGAERLPEHVAVPLREQHDRRAAHVSRATPIRTSAPIRQLDPAVPRAQRPRERRRRSTCIRSRITGRRRSETLLDLWARWAAWLDKYVKNANGAAKPMTTTTASR